jgi:hypothetical protein
MQKMLFYSSLCAYLSGLASSVIGICSASSSKPSISESLSTESPLKLSSDSELEVFDLTDDRRPLKRTYLTFIDENDKGWLNGDIKESILEIADPLREDILEGQLKSFTSYY